MVHVRAVSEGSGDNTPRSLASSASSVTTDSNANDGSCGGGKRVASSGDLSLVEMPQKMRGRPLPTRPHDRPDCIEKPPRRTAEAIAASARMPVHLL